MTTLSCLYPYTDQYFISSFPNIHVTLRSIFNGGIMPVHVPIAQTAP